MRNSAINFPGCVVTSEAHGQEEVGSGLMRSEGEFTEISPLAQMRWVQTSNAALPLRSHFEFLSASMPGKHAITESGILTLR